jgi:hypothetical protein
VEDEEVVVHLDTRLFLAFADRRSIYYWHWSWFGCIIISYMMAVGFAYCQIFNIMILKYSSPLTLMAVRTRGPKKVKPRAKPLSSPSRKTRNTTEECLEKDVFLDLTQLPPELFEMVVENISILDLPAFARTSRAIKVISSFKQI